MISGKYVGNRPIKLRKSNWKERTDQDALERQKVLFSLVHCVVWVFFFACLLTYVQYPTNVEFIALLTEPFSKETKTFKEERVAQVNCVSDGGN